MPLNTDEVKKVRAAMPDETKGLSDEQVGASATDTLIQQAATIKQATGQIAELRASAQASADEIASLKAKLPRTIDPALASGHLDLACERVGVLRDKGQCLPAQADALIAAIKPEGKANLSLVSADGTVMVPLTAVAGAFALNKPAPFEAKSGLQVVDRQTPGAEQDAALSAEEKRADEAAKAYVGYRTPAAK